MNGRQISAARALLRMTQSKLAELANISVPTLKRMEASEDAVTGLSNNVLAVKAALEASGISFLDKASEATGPGVALRATERVAEAK